MKDKKTIILLSIVFVIFILIVLDITFLGIDRKIVFGNTDCSTKELNYLGNAGGKGVYSLCIHSVKFIGIKGKNNEIKADKIFTGNWKGSKKLDERLTYYRGINYYIIDCKDKIIITNSKYVDTVSHMC